MKSLVISLTSNCNIAWQLAQVVLHHDTLKHLNIIYAVLEVTSCHYLHSSSLYFPFPFRFQSVPKWLMGWSISQITDLFTKT